MDMRVFWAVLAAFGVIVVVVFIGSEVQQRRQEQAMEEAWSGVMRAANDPDPMGLRRRAAEQASAQSQQDAQQAAYRQRFQQLQVSNRTLGSNQRCIGGVVVQVVGDTYTQLGSIQNPVRCSGRFADREVR
jgi:hypothetical protein